MTLIEAAQAAPVAATPEQHDRHQWRVALLLSDASHDRMPGLAQVLGDEFVLFDARHDLRVIDDADLLVTDTAAPGAIAALKKLRDLPIMVVSHGPNPLARSVDRVVGPLDGGADVMAIDPTAREAAAYLRALVRRLPSR
jgi:hypothetical protein